MADNDGNLEMAPSAQAAQIGQQNVKQIEQAEQRARTNQLEQDYYAQAVAKFAQETTASSATSSTPLQQQQTIQADQTALASQDASFTRDYMAKQQARQTIGGVMSNLGSSALVAGLLGLLVSVLLIFILVRTWNARTQLKAFGETLSDSQVSALKDRGVDTNVDGNTGFFGLTGNVVLFSLFGAIPMLVYSIVSIAGGFTMKSAGRDVANK